MHFKTIVFALSFVVVSIAIFLSKIVFGFDRGKFTYKCQLGVNIAYDILFLDLQ